MARGISASSLAAALDRSISAGRPPGTSAAILKLDLPTARSGIKPALASPYGSARQQRSFGRECSLSETPAMCIGNTYGLPSGDLNDANSASAADSPVRKRNPDRRPRLPDLDPTGLTIALGTFSDRVFLHTGIGSGAEFWGLEASDCLPNPALDSVARLGKEARLITSVEGPVRDIELIRNTGASIHKVIPSSLAS